MKNSRSNSVLVEEQTGKRNENENENECDVFEDLGELLAAKPPKTAARGFEELEAVELIGVGSFGSIALCIKHRGSRRARRFAVKKIAIERVGDAGRRVAAEGSASVNGSADAGSGEKRICCTGSGLPGK